MRQSVRLTVVLAVATTIASAALARRGDVPQGGAGTSAGASCFGDCNGDGLVTIDELITLVNLGLGAGSIDECPGGGGEDGTVTIDDLVRAVAQSFTGCGGSGGGLRLRPDAGPPGGPLLATGDKLAAAVCRIDFHLGSADGPPLGTAVPDDDGTFSANLFIPGDAAPGAVSVVAQAIEGGGEACDAVSSDRRSAPFTITTSPYLIRFRTRAFVPPEALQLDEIRALRSEGADTVHFLLQFRQLPDEAAQRALAAAGITLLGYATGNAYVASATSAGLDALPGFETVRFAGPLAGSDKISIDLADGHIGPWAQTENGVVVTIQFHADVSPERAEAIAARFGEVVGSAPSVPAVTAIVPLGQVEALAGDEAVLSVDVAAPPLEAHNDGARAAANVTPLATAPYNLNGTGVTVLVYDVGRIDTHTDFGARIIQNDGSNVADHSTHVGGTVGGSGANSNGNDSAGNPNGGTANQWAGMAPACNLRSFGNAGSTDTLYDIAGDLNADFMTALNAGTDLATMSLGNNVKRNCFACAQLGDYTNTAILIDNIVRGTINGQQLIYFQSAGNERGNRPAACGMMAACAPSATGFSSIASPATSKNGICVGAVNSNDNSITTFTSFGPTDDGRLKPDISGPGCQSNGDGGLTSPSFIDLDPDGAAGPMMPNGVLDAGETRNAYVVKCGTSMSTPAAAGSAALLIQQWRSTRGANSRPLPHTVKAIFAHTATDRGTAGPDYQFGFGTFNAQAAVDLVRADDTANIITIDQVSAGQTDFYTFNSDGSTNPRVTLAWDDPAAVRLAVVTLVNDLDLRLIDPDGVVYQPFVLNPAMPAAAATTGNDARNNVEMIVGTAKAGSWTVQVTGTTVPQGPQQYTLIAPDAVMNRKPVCNADGPYTFECAVAGALNGSGSSDPDGDPLTFAWNGPFTPAPASGATPSVVFGNTGSGAVTLAVSDGKATSTCGSTVTVRDTLPPILPPDVTAECTSPLGTPVALGTPSDLCDPSVSFVNDAPLLFPLGTTTVSWTAVDDSGNTTMGTQRVDVVDTTPPAITLTATPPELWPPDHRLVNVHIDVQVTDACDAMPSVSLLSIISSDPDSGTGPHDEPNDVQGATIGTDDRFFRLRAEHHPGGLRTYTVSYRAVDASGNASIASVVVRVPKSIAEIVSRERDAGNGASVAVAIDGDGRAVAFPSDADNLIPGDGNGARDVFLRDRTTRVTELVSVNPAGEPANGPSHAQGGAPALSDDGTLVAFYSEASDLVAGDGNGVADVFLRDRVARTTDRLSVGLGASEANGASQYPSMSSDGRYVAFQSLASNLVAGDSNGVADVFVVDRASGAIERPCATTQGNGASTRPAISPDGRFVAFASLASNLVPGDSNGRSDIFLCDRVTGGLTRVSVSSAGVEGNGDSLLPAVSFDGAVVAFKSTADNLVPDDRNGVVDVFAHELATGVTERISVSRTQADADDAAFPPGISHDGRFVVFGSLATNLVDGDRNQVPNVFVRDRTAARTLMADVNDDGETGNGAALDVAPAVTGDGVQIGFVSVADNLVALPSETANVFVVCNPFLATPPAVPPSGP